MASDNLIEDIGSVEFSTTQSDSMSSGPYLGFVIANIVKLWYYSARSISGGEMLVLVRNTFNTYDKNVIEVRNTSRYNVGQIERDAAEVSAPLIDSHHINVEGIVPNTFKKARFKIPCQIRIFARNEAIQHVMSAISHGGLKLISGETPSDAVVVEEKRNGKDVKSVDEIFKLVNDNVGGIGGLVESLEPPKDVITSELFEHQKYALGWLVGRENLVELPPFWEEKDGMYVNVLTNLQTGSRPEPYWGGIFAYDTGLGKTLTLLSLSACDKNLSGNGDQREDTNNDDDSTGKKSKRGRKGKRAAPSNSKKKRKIDSSDV